MPAMKILGISGSLRRGSHNTSLLRAAAQSLPSGVELEVFDGLADLPHYDADLDVDPVPESVARLRDAIAQADGVLISTPEFNGSIPGALKNALDWASRPFPDNAFRGKPVTVVGASTGLFGAVWAQAETRKSLGIIGASTGLFGAVWAQAEARKVLGAIGAEVVDRELPVMQAHMQFDEYGNLREEDLRGQLAEHVAELVEATRERTEPRVQKTQRAAA